MSTDVECSKQEKERKSSEKRSESDQGLLDKFASYSTLHGLHFVFDSFVLVRRLAWAILVIAGTGFLIVQCIQRYEKLSSKDTLTLKKLKRNKEVLFPAVTICNLNMLVRDNIIGTEAQAFMDDLEALYSKKKLRNDTKGTFNLDLDRIVKKEGHNLTKMLLDCSFQQESCSSKNFSISVFPKRGLCYTFNSGKAGYPPYFTTAGGRKNALVLFLMAQPSQYYGPYSTDGTGFRVMIHDQNEWPDVENHGIDISPGINTVIPIERKKIIRLKSPYESNCGDRQLRLFQYYSRSACFFECLTKTIVDKCHCRLLGTDPIDKLSVSRYCGPVELVSCAEVVQGDLLFNSTSCDCPLECEQVFYDIQVFTSTFPSTTFNTTAPFKKFMFLTGQNTEEAGGSYEEKIRKNVAQVQIFYKTTTTEISQETPAYNINDFGADIGGSMGLFLGCSLLTLCEFVDLFIIFCLTRISSRRRMLHISK